jgi:hypothetical protein
MVAVDRMPYSFNLAWRNPDLRSEALQLFSIEQNRHILDSSLKKSGQCARADAVLLCQMQQPIRNFRAKGIEEREGAFLYKFPEPCGNAFANTRNFFHGASSYLLDDTFAITIDCESSFKICCRPVTIGARDEQHPRGPIEDVGDLEVELQDPGFGAGESASVF